MKKKTKVILACIIVVIIILGGLLTYKIFFSEKKEEKPPVTNITNITNKIEAYSYTLDDRDSDLFEGIFKELKQDLESEAIDEEIYAKTLSELFIIDLYTIDNKISKYDIGGLEYMAESARESFRSKVLDTIYASVEDNSYKTRKQNLPIVETISTTEVKKTTYKMGDEKKDAYNVTLSWTYKEDFGYDKGGVVTLIKNDNKLEVVAFSPSK